MKISDLFEADSTDMTVSQVASKLTDFLKKAEADYRDQAEANSKMPISNTMSAHRGGMIELAKNVTIHGAYNTSVTYDLFLKIGGKLHNKVQVPIENELKKLLSSITGDVPKSNTHIKCKDGNVSVATTYGTNWGGIGMRVSK